MLWQQRLQDSCTSHVRRNMADHLQDSCSSSHAKLGCSACVSGTVLALSPAQHDHQASKTSPSEHSTEQAAYVDEDGYLGSKYAKAGRSASLPGTVFIVSSSITCRIALPCDCCAFGGHCLTLQLLGCAVEEAATRPISNVVLSALQCKVHTVVASLRQTG